MPRPLKYCMLKRMNNKCKMCHLSDLVLYTSLHETYRQLCLFRTDVDQGWVSSGRNLFLPGQRKKHGFFRIFPLSSGRNGRMGSMIRIEKLWVMNNINGQIITNKKI